MIPAAGLGTRFLPATKASPKEMLPLVDKPLIQYVVEEAVSVGIDDILMITGRNKRALEDHFDRAPELEAELAAKGKDELLRIVREIAPRPHNSGHWTIDACLSGQFEQHVRAVAGLADHGVEAVRELEDELFGERGARAGVQPAVVHTVLAVGDVGPHGGVEQYRLLGHEPEVGAQGSEPQVADVHAVDRDAPALYVPEPRQELGHRRLPGARGTHQRHRLAGRDGERARGRGVVQAGRRRPVARRVVHGHVGADRRRGRQSHAGCQTFSFQDAPGPGHLQSGPGLGRSDDHQELRSHRL